MNDTTLLPHHKLIAYGVARELLVAVRAAKHPGRQTAGRGHALGQVCVPQHGGGRQARVAVPV